MEYEIVTIDEKIVVGIGARTNNMSTDMCNVIGGLWNKFFQDGIYQEIKSKKNKKSLGIYTDYDGTEKEDYSIIVGCEVSDVHDIPNNTITISIPAGKYAKFIVKGHVETAVSDFWEKLWHMNLPRAFTCDFEEYQNDDIENAEIYIFISLKE